MTANARSLKNFFRLRCCNRAQWEIRALAEEMYKQVYAGCADAVWSLRTGLRGRRLHEGKMSCGKAAEVRAHYQTLREASNPQSILRKELYVTV